ncbi:hypothetical protein AA103196_1054 [Ameyamaea chiangmaiensis NBRC 103196]|nr:hypothetical protein AA103196_1054 [Ameyamaea chiangmaiensis NBRC 103196]
MTVQNGVRDRPAEAQPALHLLLDPRQFDRRDQRERIIGHRVCFIFMAYSCAKTGIVDNLGYESTPEFTTMFRKAL